MSSEARVSRRNLLKGLGLGAAGLAFGDFWLPKGRPALAQVSSQEGASAIYRGVLGEYSFTVINDFTTSLPVSNFGVNVPEAEVSAFFESLSLPAAGLPATVQLIIFDNGQDLVLLDTGVGGRLLPSLELLGIAAGDISHVILTHFHPDHIGGVALDGAPTFPNAQYLLSQTEWDFLQSNPEGPAAEAVATALATLQPVIDADLLDFYAPEGEILTGIEAVPSPGHTPGHTALLMSSNGQTLLNIADTAISAYANLENPGWHFGFDAIPEVAVETRNALLSRAVAESLTVFGYHFPFPGIGKVTPLGEGYRWLPAAF